MRLFSFVVLTIVLAKVQITLRDATVQVNYRTPDASQEYLLKVKVQRSVLIDYLTECSHFFCSWSLLSNLSLSPSPSLPHRIEFFDEQCQQESSVDSDEGEDPPKPVAMTVKVLQLSGLTVELGSSDLTSSGREEEEEEEAGSGGEED